MTTKLIHLVRINVIFQGMKLGNKDQCISNPNPRRINRFYKIVPRVDQEILIDLIVRNNPTIVGSMLNVLVHNVRSSDVELCMWE